MTEAFGPGIDATVIQTGETRTPDGTFGEGFLVARDAAAAEQMKEHLTAAHGMTLIDNARHGGSSTSRSIGLAGSWRKASWVPEADRRRAEQAAARRATQHPKPSQS